MFDKEMFDFVVVSKDYDRILHPDIKNEVLDELEAIMRLNDKIPNYVECDKMFLASITRIANKKRDIGEWKYRD